MIARRLIAERCLYGVDLNPLAVELAKLSIWLVTLAKGRPFGFLDHNLRCGDSLLGIHRLDQLTELSMDPTGKGQQRLFGQEHRASGARGDRTAATTARDAHPRHPRRRGHGSIGCRCATKARSAGASSRMRSSETSFPLAVVVFQMQRLPRCPLRLVERLMGIAMPWRRCSAAQQLP